MRWISLYASVGTATGKNSSRDLKIAQALLNVYLRSKNKPALKITTKINDATNQAILEFQKNHQKMTKPDGKMDAHGDTYKSLLEVLKKSFTKQAIVAPSFGTVTWESEGAEGGIFHSRKLHVPSDASGLTIGRGYDMKEKEKTTVLTDFASAGISAKHTEILKKAVGLHGATAKQFIIDNDLLDFQISSEVQKKLFKISYDFEKSEVKRICTKKDVVEKYGSCDWDKLNASIKDIVIDMKFRGDYTPKVREFMQKTLVDNDLAAFKKIIIDKTNWSNVPEERFKKRKIFINKATTTITKGKVAA